MFLVIGSHCLCFLMFCIWGSCTQGSCGFAAEKQNFSSTFTLRDYAESQHPDFLIRCLITNQIKTGHGAQRHHMLTFHICITVNCLICALTCAFLSYLLLQHVFHPSLRFLTPAVSGIVPAFTEKKLIPITMIHFSCYSGWIEYMWLTTGQHLEKNSVEITLLADKVVTVLNPSCMWRWKYLAAFVQGSAIGKEA